MSEGFPNQDERSHDVERDHAAALAGDALRTQAAQGRDIIDAVEAGVEITPNYEDMRTQPHPAIVKNEINGLYTALSPDATDIVERLDSKADRIEGWAAILHDNPVDPHVAESWAPKEEHGVNFSTPEGLVEAENELQRSQWFVNDLYDKRQKIPPFAPIRDLNKNAEDMKGWVDDARAYSALIDTATSGNMISKEQFLAIAHGNNKEIREALAS